MPQSLDSNWEDKMEVSADILVLHNKENYGS